MYFQFWWHGYEEQLCLKFIYKLLDVNCCIKTNFSWYTVFHNMVDMCINITVMVSVHHSASYVESFCVVTASLDCQGGIIASYSPTTWKKFELCFFFYYLVHISWIFPCHCFLIWWFIILASVFVPLTNTDIRVWMAAISWAVHWCIYIYSASFPMYAHIVYWNFERYGLCYY